MKRYLMLGGLLSACSHAPASAPAPGTDPGDGKPALSVTSTAFVAGGAIPKEYTCEGGDAVPPVAWSGAPAGTKAYAMIVDDPDAPDPAAPKKTHVHFVAGFGGDVTAMPAAAGSAANVTIATNDSDNKKWNGPCPPIGRHRYFFKVYALDTEGLVSADAKKPDVLTALAGHVLAKGELIGTYEKEKK